MNESIERNEGTQRSDAPRPTDPTGLWLEPVFKGMLGSAPDLVPERWVRAPERDYDVRNFISSIVVPRVPQDQ